jgi:peroxiredoxin
MTKSLQSIFLGAAAFLSLSSVEAAVKVGAAAPNFTLTDAQGKKHSLADYKGKTVVLEWVNFDCPYVKKHYGAGNMQALQKQYTGKGVVWLGINSSNKDKQGNFKGKELADRLKKEKFVATAYLIDEDGKVGKEYGAKTTPHMFVINDKGTLLYDGAIDDKPTTEASDIKGAKNFVALGLDEIAAGKASLTVSSSKPYGCSVKY